MSGSIRKWMVGAFLLGALACAGAAGAQSQDRHRANGPRPGSRADARVDQHELRIQQERIRRDKQAIRDDSRRYGKNSSQVQADRAQLKRDERELKQLKKDMKHDRRVVQQKNDR
jgi:hypothetical protein